MHELSLSRAIVETAVKHAGGRRVSAVSLRVGRLRQVVPDTLAFYFEFVARDTVCEGARLEQEVIEARLHCIPCDREWAIEIPAFRCLGCGSANVEVVAGEELEIDYIEVTEEEAACTAPR